MSNDLWKDRLRPVTSDLRDLLLKLPERERGFVWQALGELPPQSSYRLARTETGYEVEVWHAIENLREDAQAKVCSEAVRKLVKKTRAWEKGEAPP